MAVIAVTKHESAASLNILKEVYLTTSLCNVICCDMLQSEERHEDQCKVVMNSWLISSKYGSSSEVAMCKNQIACRKVNREKRMEKDGLDCGCECEFKIGMIAQKIAAHT